MPNVGKLTIDLEAGTYSYTSALDKAGADAEKAAGRINGAFGKVDTSEARGGMMLFDDLVGVKLPRHVTSFISSLGPVGAAMEAAFPFLAIAVGASVLIEHLAKVKEAAEKLDADTAKFGVTVNTAFNTWDDRLLQAQVKADELSGNHLGALQKQLELIDHASMKELMQTFDQLAAAVDAVFKDLKSHWYDISLGSEGAQHALDQFKKKYDLLLSEGKDKDAGDLLKGTIDSAQKAKQELEEIRRFYAADTPAQDKTPAEFEKVEGLKAKYRAQTYQGTMDQIEAQDKLLEILNATVAADQKRAAVVAQEKDNARTATSNKLGNEAFRRMKEEEQQQREADRRQEEIYREAVKRIQDGEKDKIAATKQGTATRLAAIDAAITEENHKGLQETEYYKELGRQRIELIRQMADQEAKDRLRDQEKALSDSIALTKEETTAQVAAIKEQANLHLLTKKQEAAALKAVYDKEITDLINFIQQEIALENAAAEASNAQGDFAAEDQHKQKALDLQNQLNIAILQYGKNMDAATAIGTQKAMTMAQAWRAAMNEMIQDGQQWQTKVAQLFKQTVDQMNSNLATMVTTGKANWKGLAQNAIESIIKIELQYLESKILMLAGDQAAHAAKKTMDAEDKLGAAKKAFHNTYAAVSDWPIVGPILAPELAAAAFAAVMAFNKGGVVPGSGNGDIIPALLTPGERVLTVHENQMLSKGNLGTAPNGGAQSVHYNPVINGHMDEKLLHQHFERWARAQSRKRGQRWN